MNTKSLVVALLLIAAIATAAVGGAMYLDSPKNSFARLMGILMMSIGTPGFGLLALAFFLGWPPRSRILSLQRDTPLNRWRFRAGMVCGVIFGALSLWYALGAVVAGEFPGGRGRGSVPTRFADSPGWFTVKFFLFSGMGIGLFWICLPPVLRGFAPGKRQSDEAGDGA